MLTKAELALAEKLIDALDLEDLSPDEINPEASLFGFDTEDSLGLDSIDALEISLCIAKHYDVHLKADDQDNHKIFSSLRSLNAHIEQASL